MNRGQSGQTFNIGSGERFSNVEIVQMITEIMKNETAISYVKDRPGHDHRYALDSSKFRKLENNHNTIAIKQGLRNTLNYYEDYSKTKTFQEEFELMENSYGS
jgi:dTDP-glucose 4,6-dehydratase